MIIEIIEIIVIIEIIGVSRRFRCKGNKKNELMGDFGEFFFTFAGK